MKNMSLSESEYKRMTETPIFRLIFSLSLPTVISNLMSSIYNTADTYFVSILGDSAIGAVGIVFSLQSIIQAFGFGIAMGSSSLISRNLGAKKNDEANKYASSAFYFAMLCGLLITVLSFIDLDSLLLFFGSTDTILPYAREYATVILLSSPFVCALYVINQNLRAEGKATFSMISMLCGGFINIILDPIFIFTFKMGVAGAAVATVISQIINFSISISFYLRGKSIISLSPKNLSRSVKDYFLIIKTGAPTVFRQGLGCVSTTMLNVSVKAYDDAAIAAVSLANKVYMIIRGIVLGVGQGFQPVAGYNYGAKRYSRVRSAFLVATLFGSIVSCLGAIFIGVFPEVVMEFFKNESSEVVVIGSRMLRFLALALPFLGYSSYVNMLYQSLGFVKQASLLASCRQGIYFIPLVLILPSLLGLDGIITVQAVADILTFLTSIPFHVYFMRRILGKAEES